MVAQGPPLDLLTAPSEEKGAEEGEAANFFSVSARNFVTIGRRSGKCPLSRAEKRSSRFPKPEFSPCDETLRTNLQECRPACAGGGAAGGGGIGVEWPYARRANRYRVFLKRIGTDDEFINVDDAEDLNLLLKDLTPGTTIEVYVVAAVANKYAPPSPIVSKVVGA